MNQTDKITGLLSSVGKKVKLVDVVI